jgi:hypothetical protein
MPRKPVVQFEDNEWYTISWKNQREKCCDCNLQHDVDYQVIDGKLQMRARRVGKK